MQNFIRKRSEGGFAMATSGKNTISLSEFYEENLYRLQDGVLNIVKNCGTPLYLTGGTALSRAYYRHRYSDDLDFFVNNDNSFNQYVDAVLDGLRKAGYDWSVETGFVKSPDFRTLVLRHPDFQMGLKLDFVNDIAAHYGEITETDLFYRTDSVRNILSNKVTAIFRMSAKDIVDIHRICLNEKFEWREVFEEVREKELGVEPLDVSQVMQGITQAAFESIKWKCGLPFAEFKRDIDMITADMLCLKDNSLNDRSMK